MKHIRFGKGFNIFGRTVFVMFSTNLWSVDDDKTNFFFFKKYEEKTTLIILPLAITIMSKDFL